MSSKEYFLDALFSILKNDLYAGLLSWGADGRLSIQTDMAMLDNYFVKLNMMNGGSFEDFMDQLRDVGFRQVPEESKGNMIMMKHELLRPNQSLDEWIRLVRPIARSKRAAKSIGPPPIDPDNEEEDCENSIPEFASVPPTDKQRSEQSYEPLDESISEARYNFQGPPPHPHQKFVYSKLRESEMEHHNYYHPEKVQPYAGRNEYRTERDEGADDMDMYRKKIWRHQLWQILEKQLFPEIICWTSNGSAIHVKDERRLCRQVLGKHLGRSQDYTVFNTQLANHKFRKLYPRDSRKIYVHEFLRRGMGEDMWRQFKLPIDEVNKNRPLEYKPRGRPKRELVDHEPSEKSFNGDIQRYQSRRRRYSHLRRREREEGSNPSFPEVDQVASEHATQPSSKQSFREVKHQIENLTFSVDDLKSKVIAGNNKVDNLAKYIESIGFFLKKENQSEHPATGSPGYSDAPHQQQPNNFHKANHATNNPGTFSPGSEVSPSPTTYH